MSAPKRIVVTGGSRGIGRGIAERFASDGHRVLVVARDISSLAGTQIEGFAADLTHPEAADAVVAHATRALGGIDVLVSNAGAAPQGGFLELPPSAWPEGFALKMFAGVQLIRAAWPALVASRGNLIVIGGATARTPDRTLTLVSAINGGLVSMMKSIAEQGLDDGVRDNLVEPGMIDTERRARLFAKWAAVEGVTPEQFKQGIASRVRSRRIGLPRDIASAVAFLASDEADFIHGAVLDVDGGQTKGT